MNVIKKLSFVYNHPFNSENKIRGVIRLLKWQINCRINPYPIVYPYTENSKLIIWKGLTGATGNLYCGLLEYNEMSFLLNFLRPSDLFVDIGANVGAYTILASAEIKAKTIAIEPVPSTFENLTANVLINQIQNKVETLNIGLSRKKGTLEFTKSHDTVNHVAKDHEKDKINVDVDTLDSIVKDKYPSLIKIDVEGFETEVILGAENILNHEQLKAIIIELNGSGLRYGYDENKIHEKLIHKGFLPYDYNPKKRELKRLKKYSAHNTIYIRDVDYVEKRLSDSRKIRIGNTKKWV